MKIFVIGMPGCGKTTLGKQLAESLQMPFVDLDEVITENEKRSIPELFATEGEDYFRVIERKLLRKTNEVYDQFVMATGGGAPCFFDNITYINSKGISIYLNVSPGEITKRLINKGKSDRPLLKGINEDKLVGEIAEKLDYRTPYYDQAAIILESDKLTVKELEKALDKKAQL